MKQKILVGLAALALASGAWGADVIWVNPSDTIVPSAANTNAPIIDAVSFLNPVSRTFSITGSYSSAYFGGSLYSFTDCLYITNKGYMYSNPGFDFENITPDGQYRPAAWFVNQAGGFNGGSISVSGSFYSVPLNVLLGMTTLLPANNGRAFIHATNIINSGTITLGDSSLLELHGDNVDLTGGTLAMNNPGSYLDGYWGSGLQRGGGVPFSQYGGAGVPFSSPMHDVTNRLYQTYLQNLPLFGAVAYTNQFTNQILINSNMLTQIVFLRNIKPGFTNLVFFNEDSIQVQWEWVSTNYPYSDLLTNRLLLTDTFGERPEVAVGVHGTTFGQRPTYMPVNYTFTFPQNPGQGTPADAITNASVTLTNLGLMRNRQTNLYSAYQAMFVPGVSLVSDVFGGDVTNIAGRIDITANSLLNLSNAQISSFNYLRLKAPGHFAGNTGSQISAPNTDLELRSTNGLLTLSGLIAPFAQYPSGVINLYSSRFTNENFKVGEGTNAITVTNTFHVLIVDSEIDPLTTPTVETLNLTAKNLVIRDVLNVTRNLTLNSQSLTITTNSDNVFVPQAQLNLNSSSIFWPNATPGLQFMTNWGQVSCLNAIFFGGSRTQPAYDPSSIDTPYQTFINHGMVSNMGTYVWSKYFENDGAIDCGTGPFQLEQGFSVRLHDGFIDSVNGDIRLTASDLVISNTFLNAGGAIILGVTNYLDDGSYLSNSADMISPSEWYVADGLSLPVLPPYASLRGTTVYADNFTRSQQNILWAGKDKGASASGFYNNAALGGLVLNGDSPNSLFAFLPAGDNNALYVDFLDLEGSMTNLDANGKLQNIVIPANMKVYFGMLFIDGMEYSSLLNKTNNPGLVWVPEVLTNTPPVNPAPVYPALVLDLSGGGNSSQGGGGNPGTVVPGGPTKLELPGAARVGGPAGNFAAASYSGLFADTNGIGYSSAGYFTVRTTPQGRYTGKLILAGNHYSFSGKLASSSEVATVTVAQAGLHISFWLSEADPSQLVGRVSGANWSADLMAFRQANYKSVPPASTLRGTYTLIIPPALSGPGGSGFATVKTDAAGNVRCAATLADGTKVTQSSFFSRDGLWGLYAPLYGGHGTALGWMQFSSGSTTNLGGQCLWVKPAGLGPRYYPRGFTNDVQAIGSSYVRPHSGRVLSLNSGMGTLSLSGAGLSNAVVATLQLDAHNRVTSSDSTAPRLLINPSSGLFSGSMVLPMPLGRVSFQGALFQNGQFAAGYFLGPTQSGEVMLAPAP